MAFALRILLVVPFVLGFLAPARADRAVLAEMFISQNCPACPKAEANLRELAASEPGFIPLVWVVDYWDYVAEPDPMAMPESVERQRAYADRLSVRGPYTPQLVANGKAHVAGNRMGAARRLVRAERDAPRPALVSLRATAGVIEMVSLSGPLDAEILVLTVGRTTRNGGIVPNVVTGVQALGPWSGEPRQLDVPCATRCIAVVQAAGCGPVLSVAEFGPDHVTGPEQGPAPEAGER